MSDSDFLSNFFSDDDGPKDNNEDKNDSPQNTNKEDDKTGEIPGDSDNRDIKNPDTGDPTMDKFFEGLLKGLRTMFPNNDISASIVSDDGESIDVIKKGNESIINSSKLDGPLKFSQTRIFVDGEVFEPSNDFDADDLMALMKLTYNFCNKFRLSDRDKRGLSSKAMILEVQRLNEKDFIFTTEEIGNIMRISNQVCDLLVNDDLGNSRLSYQYDSLCRRFYSGFGKLVRGEVE